jgi:hypothetical protein
MKLSLYDSTILDYENDLTVLSKGGARAMGSLQRALSWLIVLAVGLAPMLVYWGGCEIGRAVQRQKWRVPERHLPVEATTPEQNGQSQAPSNKSSPSADIGPRGVSAPAS